MLHKRYKWCILFNEMSKREAKVITVGVRVTPDFHALLKKYAEKEHRTVANFMRSTAQKYIEDLEIGLDSADKV